MHFDKLGVGDLNTKYRESVVVIDKELFYIKEVQERNSFRGYFLRNPEEELELRKTKIDSTPFALGYDPVNDGGEFFTRSPVRLYKQGLNERALRIVPHNNMLFFNFGWGRNSSMKRLNEIYKGDYMSFDAAVAFVSDFENPNCAAFSRDFAVQSVDEDIDLYYRGRPVGCILEGEPVVDKDHFFLNEVLQKRLAC